MKKKLLAIAVILTLIFSQMSISVLADDGDEYGHDYSECSLSLNYGSDDSQDFYSDDTARTVVIEPTNMDGLNYTYNIQVTVNDTLVESGDLYSFDESTGTLTFNGPAFWNSRLIQDLDPDYRDINLEVTAVDAEGEEIAWVFGSLSLREPSVDVSYLVNDTMEVGDESYIPEEGYAYVYAKGRNGESVDLKVTSARFTDESFGTFKKNEEGLYTVPAKTGKAVLEVTFENVNDPDDEVEYKWSGEISLVGSSEAIGISYDSESGVFPGSDVTLNIDVAADVDNPDELKFEWSIPQEASDAGCKLTYEPDKDKFKATLHIGEKCTDSFEITLSAYRNDELFDQTTSWLSIDNHVYKIFTEEFDSGLAEGEEFTFTPVLKEKSPEDTDFQVVENAEFEVSVDDKDEAASLATITVNSNGSYTIKRLSSKSFSISIDAYRNEDGNRVYLTSDSRLFDTLSYNVWLSDSSSYDLYSGSTKTLTAEATEGVLSKENYSLNYKIFKATGKKSSASGDGYDLVWQALDNTDNKYFTANGQKVTLNGTSVWNDFNGGYTDSDPDRYPVRVTADLMYKDKVLASGDCVLYVTAPKNEYYLYDMDILLGRSGSILDGTGQRYDAEHPTGQEFNYEIVSVASANKDIAEAYKDPDTGKWTVTGKKLGTTVLTYKVKALDTGTTEDVRYNVNVNSDAYFIDFDNSYTTVLPGDIVNMKAQGSHYNYSSGMKEDFTFEWSLNEGSKYASLTSNNDVATIKINGNIPDSELESDIEVTGTAYMIVNNKKVCSETFKIYVSKQFYVMDPSPESINEYLPVNDSVTITPSLTERTYKSGVSRDNTVTDFVWSAETRYPEDVELTRNGAALDPQEKYTGSFSAKRLTYEYTVFSVDAYVPEKNEDGTVSYRNVCTNYYEFTEFTPIESADITNIVNKTYTGKAQTQNLVVSYDDETLKPNVDYKITYKNNTNAGTASIVLTGIGRFYDQTTVTFKINKAANTLKVTVKKPSLKYSSLKKKNLNIAPSKAYTVSAAQGKVTYKLAGVTKSKFKKYFSVNSKTGKITVKKGLKKGTYKVKVKVTAAGTANYNAGSRTVTVVVKVK